MDEDWRRISLWWDGLDEPLTPRPALAGDIVADIAIIGAGYTGLWTAYYLKTRAPHLNIAVLEARRAGFGASGRNGGWVMGAVLGENRLVGHLPEPQRRESWALLHAIPDEVGRVTAQEAIGCDFRKGGTLYCAARYPEQETRLRGWLHELYSEGYQESDAWWLPPEELSQQLRLHGALGALYTPHCATIQPAKLARGLAVAVERLGVRIYEHTPATAWQPGQVQTAQGKVNADWVIPAVEGYAATLPPLGAYQLPVQSLLIATEPLPASVWAGIGLSRGQSFSEFSRQVTYGQRTADDRLVFGARGGYRFSGKLRTDFTLTAAEEGLRRHLLTDLFPQLRDAKKTLGAYTGGYIRLSRGASGRPWRELRGDDTVAIAEGIETALAVALLVPEWRVCSAVSLANLPSIALPDSVRDVVVCADNDAPNSAAVVALKNAIDALLKRGIAVRVARPEPGVKDWNDALKMELGET